jgi:pimeloyl-ACP methyl ester carboxylesterase
MIPAAGMTRADLKYLAPPKKCAGVLVLCPGYNGDGEFLLRQKEWQDFAKQRGLALVALSFASEQRELSPQVGRGYYYVERGSGKLLLEGLRKIIGRDVPICIFGVSGGGHFAHRFVYQFPERVRVWAVYSIGWYAEAPPLACAKPPGVFLCGMDDERLGATRDAFLSARRANWQMCWLGVPNNGHSIDAGAADFARVYFSEVLKKPVNNAGLWRFVNGQESTQGNAAGLEGRGLEGFWVKLWFPSDSALAAWQRFPSLVR